MRVRAWLNNDLNSNEMMTYIIPKDCRMTSDFEKRRNSYENERNKHVKQMEHEIVGLALICRDNGIYKDLFKLLRDGYIFRPVERKKWKEIKIERRSEMLKDLFMLFLIVVCMFFTVYIIYLIDYKQYEPPSTSCFLDKCITGIN